MHRILHALATERFETIEGASRVEEWLLRPVRRGRARRALRAADQLTQHADVAHVARVARLVALGATAGLALDDRAAVTAAYAQVPASVPRGWPRQTLVFVGGLLVLFAAGITTRVLMRPFAADRTPLGGAFAHAFGAHVAAVGHGARPDPGDAVHKVFRGNALPAAAQGPMKDLFAAQIVAAKDATQMTDVFAKTRDVNRALSAAGEPYYLDARYYLQSPILYAFYKERESEGSAPGFATERMVYLWRLDGLNLTKAALGYTHREADAGIVLYDQIEEFLIQDVLPALADGEKVELIDTASRDEKKAWQDDIETRAGRMVRESFAGASDGDKMLEVGTLLARRRAILRKWRSDLSAQGKQLREPRRLLPEADYVKDLWSLVPSASRREWEDVHDALGSTRVLRTFESLRDLFAEDVVRHELQHRFDAQKTPSCNGLAPCASLDIPAAVRSRVGPKGKDEAVGPGSMPGRVRNETSAYLAEMARPGGMPKMTILGLLRTVLDRDAWGDAYCNTTLVLLDVLGGAYGLIDEGMPLVVGGAVQRAAVASLVTILFAKTDDELRATSSKAWRDLYGYDLPVAQLKTVSQGKRWRH
jgi:hypothetical protein